MNECNRGCPCRGWVTCHKYNKSIWESFHPDDLDKELHEYYETKFRIKYELPESFPNG